MSCAGEHPGCARGGSASLAASMRQADTQCAGGTKRERPVRLVSHWFHCCGWFGAAGRRNAPAFGRGAPPFPRGSPDAGVCAGAGVEHTTPGNCPGSLFCSAVVWSWCDDGRAGPGPGPGGLGAAWGGAPETPVSGTNLSHPLTPPCARADPGAGEPEKVSCAVTVYRGVGGGGGAVLGAVVILGGGRGGLGTARCGPPETPSSSSSGE